MIFETFIQQQRQRRELIRGFRSMAAGSEEMARTLQELGVRDSPALRKLLRQRIVVRDSDRYYLDEQGLIKHRMNMVKWAMITLFLALGLILLKINS